ncbi:hypothetical protein [Photobacterium lutimaris]|uniref:Uncharacterized protein n=1 Tax=Photobacterium lutimaris TaxID=388278 RepID=A0A2T3IY00_9GAMM|nr:hypothetical protein [Photobacterium lutimaris]PSU33415.1 hypothetical protein C9I99_14655 [Photobacterium lutimaris]
MLFKEKLLLSNCDSVRKLNKDEIRKRFLTGMAFADGVVLSPNTLIDNIDFYELITRRNLVKYLNEEGSGKLVIRGFNCDKDQNLIDYFERLPPDYIISSFYGSPKKSELTDSQYIEISSRIKLVQQALDNINYNVEKVTASKEALRNEISKRLDDNAIFGHYFLGDGERLLFKLANEDKYSRSQWYQVSDDYFGNKSPVESSKFKAEVINPAYNSLFASKGEGFLQDDIKFLQDVPEVILDSGIIFKSLKNEIKLIEYPYKAFELVTSFGSGEIMKYITDEALGYIEDKLTEKGQTYLTRKNWFGMYNRMQSAIGLELK